MSVVRLKISCDSFGHFSGYLLFSIPFEAKQRNDGTAFFWRLSAYILHAQKYLLPIQL